MNRMEISKSQLMLGPGRAIYSFANIPVISEAVFFLFRLGLPILELLLCPKLLARLTSSALKLLAWQSFGVQNHLALSS